MTHPSIPHGVIFLVYLQSQYRFDNESSLLMSDPIKKVGVMTKTCHSACMLGT